MKIRFLFTALLLLISTAGLAPAQEVLTNESVVKLIKAKLGEGLIVSMINSQPGKYELTSDALIKLKQEGVSDNILAAMIGKNSGGPSSPAAKSTDSSKGAPSEFGLPPDMEIGAYFKKGDKWVEMLPEVVNWKTGGVLKHIATAGIVQGDVNGRLDGEHSHNSAASPLEVVVYTPEGVAITEYQLLRLREEKESREFRTVTGGVMHASGGATRDVVPFEGKKVANRIYRVLLPSLGAGEYGFLPPGAVTSSSSASIGKMFTFRLIE